MAVDSPRLSPLLSSLMPGTWPYGFTATNASPFCSPVSWITFSSQQPIEEPIMAQLRELELPGL